jgi:hypothetical protein
MGKRGEYTPEAALALKDFLGRESSCTELRLIPYVAYCAQNEGRLDPNRINGEERQILQLWREAGYIEGGASGLAVSREFWDFMSAILWLAYVDVERG